jgi:hypothetical protein
VSVHLHDPTSVPPGGDVAVQIGEKAGSVPEAGLANRTFSTCGRNQTLTVQPLFRGNITTRLKRTGCKYLH